MSLLNGFWGKCINDALSEMLHTHSNRHVIKTTCAFQLSCAKSLVFLFPTIQPAHTGKKNAEEEDERNEEEGTGHLLVSQDEERWEEEESR